VIYKDLIHFVARIKPFLKEPEKAEKRKFFIISPQVSNGRTTRNGG
jgi:hypothetical protein